MRVNGVRALRLEPYANDVANSNLVNVVGGSPNNSVAFGIRGATIAGGGALLYAGAPATNSVKDDLGTVGGGVGNTIAVGGVGGTIAGGYQNWAGANYGAIAGGYQNSNSVNYSAVGGGVQNNAGDTAVVGGGQKNSASGFASAVGGGVLNIAGGNRAFVGGGSQNFIGSFPFQTVAGGYFNWATAMGAAISGGLQNSASGSDATVPGGSANTASGDYSFAAGRQAKANHLSAFVWADSAGVNGEDFASTGTNQFLIRARGGGGIGTNNPAAALHVIGNILASGTITGSSDRNVKENFAPVDAQQILERVSAMPVQRWNYIGESIPPPRSGGAGFSCGVRRGHGRQTHLDGGCRWRGVRGDPGIESKA